MKRRIAGLEVEPDHRDVVAVIVVVDRIGLRLPDDAGIDDVGGIDQSDTSDLVLGERDQVGIGRVPQRVALEAEVLEPEAAHAGGHHLR